MANIKEIKKQEMSEIIDFYYFIEEYGHIFYDKAEILNKPFNKIMEGIEEVRTIIDNNYGK